MSRGRKKPLNLHSTIFLLVTEKMSTYFETSLMFIRHLGEFSELKLNFIIVQFEANPNFILF